MFFTKTRQNKKKAPILVIAQRFNREKYVHSWLSILNIYMT